MNKLQFFMRMLWTILIMSAIVLIVISVASASWVIPKTTTCNMMNLTGSECDMVWCNVIDCTYNSSLEACVCITEINTFNESEYWNKTQVEEQLRIEVDNQLEAYNESIFNNSRTIIINNTLTNNTNFDEKLLQLRTDLEGDIRDLNYNTKSSGIGDLNITWILLFIVVVFGFIAFKDKIKIGVGEQSKASQGNAPSFQRKIQSTKEMGKDEQIKEQGEQINKLVDAMKGDKKE